MRTTPNGHIVPSIHLNGTSKESLMQQLTDVRVAINALLAAMYNAFPNARDYYVQGTDAFIEAEKQWDTRIGIVNNLESEIVEIEFALDG